jgi:chaperonin GroES
MKELETRLSLRDIQDSKNVNDMLSEKDSEKIGAQVYDGYEEDKLSRADWEKKMEKAIQLALQVTKEKNTPWKNASNVKFPLLTIASLQFASRAYPSLVKAPNLVKYRVQGGDPDGSKAGRAMRISSHMSYQLLEEDEGWEEDHDRMMIALPILGCAFKKSYYGPTEGHNCSKLVLPQNLVVNYYAHSIEDCERKTEILPKLSPRKYREKVLAGIYTEHDFSNAQTVPDENKVVDERQGTQAPLSTDMRQPLEQHTYLDLDGDGYPEPYVVTIDRDTKKVLRIVHRFKEVVSEQSVAVEQIDERIREIAESLPPPSGQETEREQYIAQMAMQQIERLKATREELLQQEPKVLRVETLEHYTKYSFIPAPDGGFYDIGFGVLLGPLNNSVDTLINQLIDSGTLQTQAGGFIGRGARIKGGKVRFAPFEWHKVDVAGSDLKNNIVPIPVNQPSAVLFQLLGLLISYTERVASVTDSTVGENPGQNTPAYNMNQMLEQGLQVFNAIFKRVYRGFRSELRKLYILNGLYLSPNEYFEYQDRQEAAFQTDYLGDPKDLIPAADPNAFSDKERQQKAIILTQRAMETPGYDPIQVEKRFLEAMDIPNTDEIFPLVENPETGELQLKYPPGENPEIQVKKMEEARRTAEGEMRIGIQQQQAAADLMLKEAQVVEIYARAEKVANEPELQRLKLMLDDMKSQREALLKAAEIEERANSGVGRESGNA